MSNLFQLKQMLIEIMLQTFIGKVNTELFEAVAAIILKAKNIKDPNGKRLKNEKKIFKEQTQRRTQVKHSLLFP